MLRDVARYGGDRPDLYDRLHTFFERVASARFQHEDRHFGEGWETENLAFLGWELTLVATAVLLSQDQFTGVGRLLRPLYVTSRVEAGALRSMEVLEPSLTLIPWLYGQRRQQDYLDGTATLLRERYEDQALFQSIMEADLLLWYRTKSDADIPGWWNPRDSHVRRTASASAALPTCAIRRPVHPSRAGFGRGRTAPTSCAVSLRFRNVNFPQSEGVTTAAGSTRGSWASALTRGDAQSR